MSCMICFLLTLLSQVRMSSFYNNAFYLMLNSVTTSLLGFVFWNIMARVFSPAEIGIGSALVSASGLVATLACLGLNVGLVRFIPEVKKREIHLINSTFTMVAGLALVGSVFYQAGVWYLSPSLGFMRENLWYAILFIFLTIFTALSSIMDQCLVAVRMARGVFYRNAIISLVKLPLTIYIFSFMAGFGIFVGTGMGFMAGVLLGWLLFLPSVYPGYHPFPIIQKDLLKQVLPFSFANYLANLLSGAPSFIYPLMVLNVLGAESNAYFYITWMMTTVLSIIPNGIAQSLLAEGSHDQNRLAVNGRRALSYSLLLLLPAAVAMISLGKWLLHFFGPGYAEHGTGLMYYMVLAVLPQCLNVIFITINQVQKQMYFIIAQTGVLSIFSLGLGYLLLVKYGLNGLGIAYTLSHLLVAVVVVGPLLRRLRGKEPTHSAGECIN